MPNYRNRALSTSTTTGTGPLTLSSVALPTFQTIDAKYAVNEPFDAFILDEVSGLWECGNYKLTAANTLERTTVYDGSSGVGTLVNFTAGTKKVTASVSAEFMEMVAVKNLINIFTAKNTFAATVGTWQVETFSTTEVLDGSKQWAVLNPTANFTFSNVNNVGAVGEAQVLYRIIKQPASGSPVTASYSTTASGSTVKFVKSGTSFPVLTAALGAIDVLTFTRHDDGTWFVTEGLNVT